MSNISNVDRHTSTKSQTEWDPDIQGTSVFGPDRKSTRIGFGTYVTDCTASWELLTSNLFPHLFAYLLPSYLSLPSFLPPYVKDERDLLDSVTVFLVLQFLCLGAQRKRSGFKGLLRTLGNDPTGSGQRRDGGLEDWRDSSGHRLVVLGDSWYSRASFRRRRRTFLLEERDLKSHRT